MMAKRPRLLPIDDRYDDVGDIHYLNGGLSIWSMIHMEPGVLGIHYLEGGEGLSKESMDPDEADGPGHILP